MKNVAVLVIAISLSACASVPQENIGSNPIYQKLQAQELERPKPSKNPQHITKESYMNLQKHMNSNGAK
jgi:starvation-inducible outer membrane lipoprotein